jgi:hypothetical protein
MRSHKKIQVARHFITPQHVAPLALLHPLAPEGRPFASFCEPSCHDHYYTIVALEAESKAFPLLSSQKSSHRQTSTTTNNNMSTEEDPRFMESYLQHAMNVIDNAKHIPKVFFKEAKGVMLISAREGGFLVSNTSGTGVLVPHNKDGTWGMPMAVHLEGFGIGAVFGYANKDIIVIMNHFAMNRLLEGRGQTKLGVDMGFACGKCLVVSTG